MAIRIKGQVDPAEGVDNGQQKKHRALLGNLVGEGSSLTAVCRCLSI